MERSAFVLDSGALNAINRGFGVVALVGGLVVLVGGGQVIHQHHLDQFLLNPAAADGQVIENTPRTGVSSNRFRFTAYQAVVRFTDQQGHPVIYRDFFSVTPPSFVLGQNVTMLYDPDHPARAMIDRGPKNYLLPGVCAVVGLLMILGGLQRISDAPPVLSTDPTPQALGS